MQGKPVCNACGHTRDNHPYRHPFIARLAQAIKTPLVVTLPTKPDMAWSMLQDNGNIAVHFDCGDAGAVTLAPTLARQLRDDLTKMLGESGSILPDISWTKPTFTSSYGEVAVYLRPHYTEKKRDGITDCCFVGEGCQFHEPWHHSKYPGVEEKQSLETA